MQCLLVLMSLFANGGAWHVLCLRVWKVDRRVDDRKATRALLIIETPPHIPTARPIRGHGGGRWGVPSVGSGERQSGQAVRVGRCGGGRRLWGCSL
jgi:hypothetical protein